MMKNLRLFTALLMLLCNVSCKENYQLIRPTQKHESELTVPSLISNRMVLQQNQSVNIWGKARPGTTVTVSPGWEEKTYSGECGKDGKWKISIQTPEASSREWSMTIQDKDGGKITIYEILIGEVWHCAGQSNMAMCMRGYGTPGSSSHQPVAHAEEELKDAAYPEFRFFRVKMANLGIASQGPMEDVYKGGEWVKCDGNSAWDFYAIAFYFGRGLHKALHVPVGIIGGGYGGTMIQAWIPNDGRPTEENKSAPGIMYNGMVHPIMNYSIKGCLWYQGESDRENKHYAEDMAGMVKQWKEIRGMGKMPFYWCQIAPFASSDPISAARMMEQQFAAMELIPDSGVVSTSDVGEEKSIHYSRKKEPAERLLGWALNKTYQANDIDPMGPVYASHDVSGNKIIVTFSHAQELHCSSEEIPFVEIAGADGKFHTAKAILGPAQNQMTVWSEAVPAPQNVRYCYSSWHQSTIYDEDGLPAYIFRTDK